MKVISRIRKQFGVVDKHSFYEGKTLKEVEWWISWAALPDLYWARLRVFSDGSADAAFDESAVYGFNDRKYAGYFLGEDEYSPVGELEDKDRKRVPVEVKELSPPLWIESKAVKFKYLGEY
jgi:hypothetical protein